MRLKYYTILFCLLVSCSSLDPYGKWRVIVAVPCSKGDVYKPQTLEIQGQTDRKKIIIIEDQDNSHFQILGGTEQNATVMSTGNRKYLLLQNIGFKDLSFALKEVQRVNPEAECQVNLDKRNYSKSMAEAVNQAFDSLGIDKPRLFVFEEEEL